MCMKIVALALLALSAGAFAAPPSARDRLRPYEMFLAGRTQDAHPPLLPLVDAAGWRVEASNAQATFEQATDRLLFGDGVCRLTYRATGENPRIVLLPPAPVPVKGAFDTLSCWVYGNNIGYNPDPSTPSVDVTADFVDSSGKSFSVKLIHVAHMEWFLAFVRLPPELIARVREGATFVSFTVTGGTNAEMRKIDFNSFCVFKDALAPLTFKPRPKRPNRAFPDADAGINKGPGLLPFPNSPLGVTPPTQATPFLDVSLPAMAGNWDGLAFRWKKGSWRKVAQGGGVWRVTANGGVARAEEKDVAVVTNRVSPLDVTISGGGTKTRFHMEGRSLVVDVAADGQDVVEVRFGAWKDAPAPQAILVPYYSYGNWGGSQRPCVVAARLPGGMLFHSATLDWTQSNGTEPYALPHILPSGLTSANGGVRYRAKTDGRRNLCRERLVYCFSDRFEDVLPNVPNPPSPWRGLTGGGVWCAYSSTIRERDKAHWRAVRARGLKHVIVNDHESCWRDGWESYTFRTTPAPNKKGEWGLNDYARTMIDTLGYLYGTYNNFCDFAPVNAFWDSDRVSRSADGQLQTAWVRCYAPKPAYAVTACEELTPVIQRKFGFNTGYCDVHTALTPWSRVDYDARVPGAGTFAATYYAWGEILLLQRQGWNGPVYSEGGCHYMYCGLADGNYAQDQTYGFSVNPWLVDFDLRRLHPLCCNFGMGNEYNFYWQQASPTNADERADRLLAATMAFGHPGILLQGQKFEDRSYFMIQALAARYTQAEADKIRYLAADGCAHDITKAIENGCYRRSQVVVRYTDGTFVAANGSTNEFMRLPNGVSLPPNGYCGWSGDGAVFVYSGLVDGHRVDYSVSPEYVYMDGRGVPTSLPGGKCCGAMVRLREKDDGVWPTPSAADFAEPVAVR